MRLLCLLVGMAAFIATGCAWQQLFARSVPLSPEEQLDELVRTIDDNPDWAHANYTPSVHKLIALGEPAIPRMLDLMLLDGRGDGLTRLHAESVLWGIVMRKNGFGDRGWADPEGLDRANAMWKSLGDLQDTAPLEDRQRAVRLWREWLAKSKSQ